MKLSMLATGVLAATSLLAAPAASAQDCDGDDGYRLIAESTYPLGVPASAVLETPGSHQAFLLLSLEEGPSRSPFGRLCVGPLLAPPFPISVRDGRQRFDCGVPCSDVFLGKTFFLQFVAISTERPEQLGRSNQVSIQFRDSGCGEKCPSEAISDEFGPDESRHAWSTQCIGHEFVFDRHEPRSFEELGDGTARLRGTLVDEDDSDDRWLVDVHFFDRVDAGDPPPEGSPKKELHPSAYVENGGPVDPRTWHYYVRTEGTITGLGDNDGCTIQISRDGPAFQVGVGANGKNVRYGASGWLDQLIDCRGEEPFECKGDFNLNLDDDCR